MSHFINMIFMKLFIFDMGNVVTHNVSTAPKIAKSFGISEDDFYIGAGSLPSSDTSPYNKGDIGEFQRGNISTNQFWENFTKRTGIKVNGDPWAAFFEPIRDPETYRIIDDLKKAGFRVVCGTNSLEAHYNHHVKHGEYDCFDKVYASQIMHVIKPDPDFWLQILREEQVEPKDAFFTDDSEENINAAAKLGLRVHHFKDALGLRNALSDVL
jgi:putative hydrolase of the HAD superfamily